MTGNQTQQVKPHRLPHEQTQWESYRERIERLVDLQVNYDLDRAHEYTEGSGWRIDRYEAELPSEQPGEPIEGGPWQIAKGIIQRYEFPDPAIIVGFYDPDLPMTERGVMLLRAKFLFFRFWFGVKISEVIDEIRETDNGPAHVWGFSYQTLEGHFEMGQITFAVWKYERTGDVYFRVNAYSKPTRIPNIIYRIGFKIFGRWIQKRFANTALERVQYFVTERMKAEGQPIEEAA